MSKPSERLGKLWRHYVGFHPEPMRKELDAIAAEVRELEADKLAATNAAERYQRAHLEARTRIAELEAALRAAEPEPPKKFSEMRDQVILPATQKGD